ncbi:zinc ribbon domain-containing protein [Spirillospora sp. NPDC048911]|uniref:zinc ribbon domain-containing protein n=1 Tax=Spirillospora sp. NPDC048911 TaxID=3364527 RepID=UPI00371ED547
MLHGGLRVLSVVAGLEHKAPGRVVKVRAAYTSQTCSRCGAGDRRARESQAVFRCRSCTFSGHADVNAAINIRTLACGTAAGRAVAARGRPGSPGRTNREPQPALLC